MARIGRGRKGGGNGEWRTSRLRRNGEKNNHHPGFFVRRAVIEGFFSRRGSVKIKLTRLVRLLVSRYCAPRGPRVIELNREPWRTFLLLLPRRTRKNDGKSRDGNENRC